MSNKNDLINLELVCDLQAAAIFYKVEIDEVELKKYHTPFAITPEDSNSAITIHCRGCEEQIRAYVIEFPRINNFISSKFLIQILIILGITLLPFISINIDPFIVYVITGFTVLIFLSDVYSFIFKPPAQLDTLFFWHDIR